MKKIITMCLVFVFLVSGVGFATGGGQGQGQEQEQDQLQAQLQLQGINNVGNTGDSTYNSKAPVVSPYQPGGYFQQMPTKSNLWNDLAVNPLVLEGPFTVQEIMVGLGSKCNRAVKDRCKKKKYGCKEVVTSFIRLYSPTDVIDFKDASSMTISELRNDYTFIGVINLQASKKTTYFLGLLNGLRLGANNGGDLAVLSGGMNPIYHHSLFGLGLSGVSAGQDLSGSGGTGIGSGNATTQGDSAIRLAIFVKNGVEEPITDAGFAAPEEGADIVGDEVMDLQTLAEVTK